MTEQRKKITETAGYLKKHLPSGFKARLALIVDENYKLPKEIKIIKKINFRDVPCTYDKDTVDNSIHLLAAKTGNANLLILKGRLHFYDGVKMRDIGHFIYSLKYVGIDKILSVDEVGTLNPRFGCGELALVYDHINLMGDNPLIGENDQELGIRFPDMSNAYDEGLFGKMKCVFMDNKMIINESVYLGIIGPESETEAEARFYREIGCDVLGYSLVPENITAVHARTKFAGIGLITRELVADKMKADTSSESKREKERIKYFKKAESSLNKILTTLIKTL
ncbi:MAG: purine-nucleoside phosphorylase [Ignavibacteriae bacterium]|nr:purine-nucleoside phosphorylase [Ignavibacteriota bacterium]